MKALEETTLIICGIVRDAERGLRRNIPEIDALCARLGDYRIFIYENDSRDATKDILVRWRQSDPKRIHISLNNSDPMRTIPQAHEVKGNPFYCRRRIEKMARLRNRYMDYIDEQGWTGDYLMVVDMDVERMHHQAFANALADERQWDALFANGYSTSPRLRRRYHDTYALTLLGDEDRPQTEEKIRTLADKLGRLHPDDAWLRVASAYGGAALYRFDAVKGLRYVVLPNDDERVEVRCEHFSLCQQMRQRGFDRLYIDPAMELKYQRLTPSIVWHSLMRRIRDAQKN